MDENDFYSLIKMPCLYCEAKNGKTYLVAYLGAEAFEYGGYYLKFNVNGKNKRVEVSEDDFKEITGKTDATMPDRTDCCELLNDIIKNDLAEYVIDWEII